MDLSNLKKTELMTLANEKKIAGRSRMTKDELIEALRPFYSSPKKRTVAMNSENKEKLTEKSKAGITEKKGDNEPGYAEKKPADKPVKAPKRDEYPIPSYYNVDTLNFLPIDPSREYAYWEISDYTLNKIRSELRLSYASLILKVYLKSNDGIYEAASVSVDRIGNWYFDIYASDQEIWSEIGMLDSNGAFHSILVSNKVKMPADKVSDIVDDETWLTVSEETLDKIYEQSGVGQREDMNSRSVHREVTQRMKKMVGSSGNLTDK